LFAQTADIRIPYYIKEAYMDFDEYDDFEDHEDYESFDEDPFYADDFETDLEDTSGEMGPVERETSRTGLEWYEMAFLGALADELSDEKRKRRLLKKDYTTPNINHSVTI
jgi:hypothetical protein